MASTHSATLSFAEFVSTYTDAVTSFLGSKNVDSFLKTMTEAQKNQLGG